MARFLILICEHVGCGESVTAKRGDLPYCPACDPGKKKVPNWRVALMGEFTKYDRRVLSSFRISSE